MCGFVAFIQDAPVVDIETARQASDTISHRGPDARGEWREDEVVLLHRRLSIIDLHTGDQPMVSKDGRYVLVFNGEIYNFPELRKKLSLDGVVFRTQSDTEVVLEGFRSWGSKIVDRLNGIFAFVIWDRHRASVFGARDRLGIKPLCWARYRGALIVASTLEPFHVLNEFGEIDPVAVRDLMTFDYIPSPRSILRGVNKLEPGSQFSWCFGEQQPAITRFWEPPGVNVDAIPPSSEELEELLEHAVSRQMISDVPLGAFLSGGIDSSLLVAFMARHSSKPVRTFSCAFGESKVDESPIAELVAREFGTDHLVLQAEEIGPTTLLDLLGQLDEPFADPAVIPTYALSKLTSSYVRVALSGDGADEVFGGYPKYLQGGGGRSGLPFGRQLDRLLRALPWRPQHMSSLYWRTLSSQELVPWSVSRFGDFPVFPNDIRSLIHPRYHEHAKVGQFFLPWERRAERMKQSFGTDFFMRADLETYLSENCLVKTDRASMLASLEVRVPYLDETVLSRILPLSANQKIIDGELKSLLMPIAKRILPQQVWDRPKHGFDVPINDWLAGLWRPAIENVLAWGEANVDLFNYPYLRRLHQLNLNNRKVGRFLWNPFVFLAWMKHRSMTL